ncbi:MAG: hypothetical protein Q9192_005651, partial [Flavoplaca navasiana]
RYFAAKEAPKSPSIGRHPYHDSWSDRKTRWVTRDFALDLICTDGLSEFAADVSSDESLSERGPKAVVRGIKFVAKTAILWKVVAERLKRRALRCSSWEASKAV